MDDAAAEAPAPRRAPHDKRGAILRAAAELFPRQGFDKTSMDSIAERAVVSKATVYAHFASKEVLFRTTLEALAHQSPNPWEALLNMRGPLPVRLLAIADAVVRMAASNALGDAAYGLVRPPALPSQIREEMWTLGFERYDTTMRAVLAREVEQGSLVIDNLPDASVHFFGLMTGMPANAALHGSTLPAPAATQHAYVASAVALFLRAYRPQPPAVTAEGKREVPSGF
ncbi:TetR/AcrR family transcriptional regulator [Xanthomonas arboricola]|uniref:TetR/AcrR family transcriptional regulator n=1 Tax=Xanthomonas arboricola TaxID=56448 RepID=UPI001FD68568|nr:TetR/AcrR family transcriptional regulator [Xanthomonas arboricola]UOS97941.1 TetR/AcrR family transcriptional regulator [Xanthomonas arboricola]